MLPSDLALEFRAAAAIFREHAQESVAIAYENCANRVEQVKRMVSERLQEGVWEARGYGARIQALLDRWNTPSDVASQLLETLLEGIPHATPPEERKQADCS